MKFNITKRNIILTLSIIALLFLIIWGFLPSPVQVGVEQVNEAPMEVTLEEEGITRVKDRFVISAPVTGYILRVQHEVGDSVSNGNELFRVQPVPDMISARQREVALAQLESAKARLRQAEESYKLAEMEKQQADKELERIQNLFDEGIGSAQVLDNTKLAARRASANLTSSKFSVEVAEHNVEAATSALQSFQTPGNQEQIPITAPADGKILKIHHESEGPIQAGMPLMEVGNPQSLEIRADLLSTDAVKINPGTRVRIKRWGSDTLLEGIVRIVEPSGFTQISALGVEEQRVPVIMDILSPFNSWRPLGDGYRVVAEFVIWQGDDVLQVPSSSLFRIEGDQWALFVAADGHAQLRQVDIGRQSGLQTQIIDGLTTGENVITHPDERIEDGVRIEVRE